MTVQHVWVPGRPVPQGSKRAIINNRTHRAVVIESAGERHRTYRGDIREQCEREGLVKVTKPVAVTLVFRFTRPKSHYRTGRNAHLLREDAPIRMAQKPDVDKLVRSVLDALTGVVLVDDALVYKVIAERFWTGDHLSGEGTSITIMEDV